MLRFVLLLLTCSNVPTDRVLVNTRLGHPYATNLIDQLSYFHSISETLVPEQVIKEDLWRGKSNHWISASLAWTGFCVGIRLITGGRLF